MPVNYKKVDNLIESIVTMDNINWYDILKIDPQVEAKLFTFQVYCLYEMLIALVINKRNAILNGSDTGTGKTYVTAALCKEGIVNGTKHSLKPIVFCRKSLITYWHNVLKEFGIEDSVVINYEMVTGNRKEENFKYKEVLTIDHMDSTANRFKWKVNEYHCIIFDEVHNCKNPNSLHGKLLLSTRNLKSKVVMLSATVSAMPKDFAIFGYMLGFYENIKQGKSWIAARVMEDKRSLIRVRNSSINRAIYPLKGSRMDITELDDSFPKNNIIAMAYDLEESIIKEFDAKYQYIKNLSNGIKNKIVKKNSGKTSESSELGKSSESSNTKIENYNSSADILKEITAARIELEFYKVNIFVELANEYIEEGFNVVIFVNFNKTIDLLAKNLKTKNVLNGSTPSQVKEKLINDFQTNQINLLICNVGAGGESISLHNKLGKPIVSLISTQISGIKLKQTLGRIYRAGLTGYVLQRIIYCANTYEAILWDKLKEKIKFINDMNGEELNIFDDL